MRNKNSKYEFMTLLVFLTAMVLLLTNGFHNRISAQSTEQDVYQAIEPVGLVLDHILNDYARDADLDKVVEGALIGMMGSLDRHSSFINEKALTEMQEETKGEFEGIGVQIKVNDNNELIVFMPIPGSPATEAGLQPFDVIQKIDDVEVLSLWNDQMDQSEKLNAAADRIRGPRDTKVKLTILRPHENGAAPETLEIFVRRDKVAIESIKEYRILDGGIGYLRISDFKDTTAEDMRKHIVTFLDQGMKALVLDLRWNPGGLLSASKQVCELFLPKDALVTYTKGRALPDGKENPDDMRLFTEKKPVLPEEMPLFVLINEQTASSSEIVTGALQFHKRALIVGTKTYGKGSVQTIIPLQRPPKTALRLTTALYYTPADVTIDHQGILPDVVAPMEEEQERLLARQMYETYKDDPALINQQNHGTVTGNPKLTPPEPDPAQVEALNNSLKALYGDDAVKLMDEFAKRKRETDETTEDVQLLKAVEIIREGGAWADLLTKYHKDIHETQVAADSKTIENLSDAEKRLLNGANGQQQEPGKTEGEYPNLDEPLDPAAPAPAAPAAPEAP